MTERHWRARHIPHPGSTFGDWDKHELTDEEVRELKRKKESKKMNEWDNEPESADFIDEETGLHCYMRRGPGGNWCGYVGVPEGHPWFKKDYSDVVKTSKEVLEREINQDAVSVISLFCGASKVNEEEQLCPIDLIVDCHGGLTFADFRDDKELWWFGFDCAHSGDFCPSSPYRKGTYRNYEYVKSICHKTAVQIAAAIAEEPKE